MLGGRAGFCGEVEAVWKEEGGDGQKQGREVEGRGGRKDGGGGRPVQKTPEMGVEGHSLGDRVGFVGRWRLWGREGGGEGQE